MIISYHGALQLLLTAYSVIAVATAQTVTVPNNPNADSVTYHAVTESKSNSTVENSNIKNETNVHSTVLRSKRAEPKENSTENVKFQRRAPRFDSAASSPWVRVYNRPPGTQTESFYNYETRGNTSAHTSGEAWEAFKESISEEKTAPVERNDARITDILRVKPKQKGNTQSDAPKRESTTEADTTSKSTPPTKAPFEAIKEQPEKSSNKKKGYIRWSSSDGGSNAGWTLDDTSSVEEKKLPATVEKMIPKDGSHWKVLGEGGEDGWQVVDDKGDVEWKIEYDDGEWKVTSTGDVPADAEWADPEYVWGPSDGALAEEDEYNSWPADDYRIPSGWTDPELIFSGFNDTWIQKNENQGGKEETSQNLEPGWKTGGFSNNPPTDARENLPFGERRRVPSNKIAASSTEQRTDSEASEAVSDDSSVDKPQNDQGKVGSKSWIPGSAIAQGGQEWVQGYGSKSWEGGNTGWNTEVGEEQWVAANKNFDPWVPKIPGSKNVPQKPATEDIINKQDGSVRAWGTGYGSKTWKGDEWNSNVVWKTGFNGGLPLTTNNSTWTFPEQNNNKNKPETWSQPIPTSEEVPPTSKSAAPPNQRQDRTRVKWPVRPASRGTANRKSPPSRRTEGESWGDDYSVGGVVWKQKVDSTTPAPETSKPSNQENGWQGGSWAVSPPGRQWQPTAAPWKTNAQPKNKNLIGVAWNTGDYPVDAAPAIWNQAQWADPSGGPTWAFGGCKMFLKCGSKPADNADDSSDLSGPPDTPDDDSTMMTTVPPVINVSKGWPQRPKGGKSWKPPSKSWRPPQWMQPTPPPTSPDTMNPTMPWKYPPTPIMNWKKPTPPPAMWKQPPPTVIWTETTPAPPSMSWKPPPPSPQMKWKKGPKPGKSWRPPPTKSWKPPSVPPSQTWTPSIATPPPDMWSTTKPDCKDITEATLAPPQPNIEDDSDDSVDPPQIIIITKLPKGPAPTADDKKDNSKQKLPFGPWVFPQRKNVPKSSKNRKDKNIPTSNSSKSPPSRPAKNNSKQSSTLKGWPQGVPPPNFVWPSNSMRRWTTKRPQTFSTWKYPKHSKSNTWRQMFKKWMNGR